MPRFRFRHRGGPGFEEAFTAAWTDFRDKHQLHGYPSVSAGDPYLDAWNAWREYGERPLSQMISIPLPERLGRLRPVLYWRIACKYFPMNPLRLWWLGRVWDEVRSDWCGS